MSIVKSIVQLTIVATIAVSAGLASANDIPAPAPSAERPLADGVDPSAARYPPGHCYGQLFEEDGFDEEIKGQCIASCSGFDTGVVVSKRYVSVEGDHDDWCERKAGNFCDALALSLDYWCWGEEYD